MASDWDKELAQHDSTRTIGEDLRDSLRSVLKSTHALISNMPTSSKNNDLDEIYEPLETRGWKNGSQGYGYYRNGVKD